MRKNTKKPTSRRKAEEPKKVTHPTAENPQSIKTNFKIEAVITLSADDVGFIESLRDIHSLKCVAGDEKFIVLHRYTLDRLLRAAELAIETLNGKQSGWTFGGGAQTVTGGGTE